MKRSAVLWLVAFIFFVTPAALNAQGLFGSGMPSFGGFFGSTPACGDSCSVAPGCSTIFYVGWNDDPNGVSAKFTNEGTPLAGITEASHRYRLSGLWLGLTQSCPLTEGIGFVASGWYLFPSNRPSNENYSEFNDGVFAFANNAWGTKTEWWFVDGLLAFGKGSAQLLAGVRYDKLTTRFDNSGIIFGPPNRTADIISNGYIPLVGVQVAQSGSNGNLLFRVVGIPTLAGTVKYRENIGGASFEGKGNYNGGYFLEAFAEYDYKLGGTAGIGFFGRYNTTQGKSLVNFDLIPAGLSSDYRLGLHRSSWTLGGTFSLNFTLPYM